MKPAEQSEQRETAIRQELEIWVLDAVFDDVDYYARSHIWNFFNFPDIEELALQPHIPGLWEYFDDSEDK